LIVLERASAAGLSFKQTQAGLNSFTCLDNLSIFELALKAVTLNLSGKLRITLSVFSPTEPVEPSIAIFFI
jgi:hypothetical protein